MMSETMQKCRDVPRELPGPASDDDTPFDPQPQVEPVDVPPRRKPYRMGLITTFGVVVTCIAVALLVHWWLSQRFIEVTDNAYLQADSVTVAPRIDGLVRELRVEENALVAQGDVLLVIDDREYRARVDQAEAVVAARRAQVIGDKATIANLDAQLVQQQSVIDQMTASLAVADAEVERAKLDFERYNNLLASNVASEQRFETVRSDYKKAVAEQARVRAVVETEKQRLPVVGTSRRQAEAKLKQSEADLAEAEAALELARISLEDTIIRAPIAGIVANRNARIGEYARPGSSLLTIVPREPYITANFKETQLTSMRAGQKVGITIDAYPDLLLEGRVESLAPATGAQFSILPPENATGNFTKIVQRLPVRIRIIGPETTLERLNAGLSAVVSVDTRSPHAEAASLDAGTK